MALETYALSPALVAGKNADVAPEQVKAGSSIVTDLTSGISRIGQEDSGKVPIQRCLLASFDLPIPARATVAGVKLKMESAGTVIGTQIITVGGFIKPQASGPAWQDANGVSEWSLDTHVPFAKWNAGASSDSTVWHGDAPGWAATAMPITQPRFAEWSMGDGIGAMVQVPGLLAQLVSYLAANESLRGHRVAEAIPVCIQVYSPWLGGGIDNYQQVYTQDFTPGGGAAPVLIVDWDISTGPAPSLASLSAAVSGQVDSGPAVAGDVSLAPAVAGEASLGGGV